MSVSKKKPVTRKKTRKGSGSTQLRSAQLAVGNFLRTTRESRKLTQEQVASMTKGTNWQLSRAAISAIERGQNFPGMEAMLALSNVLYVDPKEIVERARLSTVVPVDITALSFPELDKVALDYFWAGDFRKAVAVYDAMLEKVALEAPEDPDKVPLRVAGLEVRRATALKRAGALLSAIATAERAIALSAGYDEIQSKAYVVLSDLQVQRGHLPLASDAANRATELSREAGPQVQGWAWMVKGRVFYLSRDFEEARRAWTEARKLAHEAGDRHHMTHIEGDIGMCWEGQGRLEEARKWLRRAVDFARQNEQPALEASWLVEIGKLSLKEDKIEEADSYAVAALKIATEREHYLTIFRGEWLRHGIRTRLEPNAPDHDRLRYLRQLYLLLDQHEGVDEVQEFKKTAMRTLTAEDRKTK
jgi:tetratricopeptide (TPR) repeat protein